MNPTRTCLAMAASLALGEALGFATGGCAPLWPWAAFACALSVCLGAGFSLRGWGLVATALLGLACAMSREETRRATLTAADLARGPFAAEVEVARVLSPNCFLASAGGVALRVALASGTAAERPREGDVWRVAGWLERKPAADRSPRALWVKGRGASAACARRRGPVREAFAAAKRDLSRRVGIGLDHAPEIADLHRAILLGERGRLPPAMRRTFADAGTLHVFAVSGLHVGVIAVTLLTALSLCAFPYRWAGLAVAPALWAYVGLIGFPPSAVRAAAMGTLALAAPAFRRRGDLLIAWAQTFVVTHVLEPDWIVDVGSLLSFAVMGAIAAWGRLFRRGFAFAAWAAGVPICAHTFGTVTPGGLVANLALLPAAGVTVLAGALGAAASYASETLAAYVNNAAALFTGAMVAVSGAVAAMPGASVAVAPWTLGQCAAWYAALALAVWLAVRVRNRRRRI